MPPLYQLEDPLPELTEPVVIAAFDGWVDAGGAATTVLEILARGGLPAEAAARAAYLIMVYVLGAIALEVADVPRAGALSPETERIAARRTAMSQVPAELFPRTAAVLDVSSAWIGTDQYLWGLHRVLDGLPAGFRRV